MCQVQSDGGSGVGADMTTPVFPDEEASYSHRAAFANCLDFILDSPQNSCSHLLYSGQYSSSFDGNQLNKLKHTHTHTHVIHLLTRISEICRKGRACHTSWRCIPFNVCISCCAFTFSYTKKNRNKMCRK